MSNVQNSPAVQTALFYPLDGILTNIRCASLFSSVITLQEYHEYQFEDGEKNKQTLAGGFLAAPS